jgi:hypothetical protein
MKTAAMAVLASFCIVTAFWPTTAARSKRTARPWRGTELVSRKSAATTKRMRKNFTGQQRRASPRNACPRRREAVRSGELTNFGTQLRLLKLYVQQM